jgi:hypothetical protein
VVARFRLKSFWSNTNSVRTSYVTFKIFKIKMLENPLHGVGYI